MIWTVLAAMITVWQGETRYHFGEVDSPLVTRTGRIADDNGFPDKVVWGAGRDVAEICANVPAGIYGQVEVLPKEMPENTYLLDLWQHPRAVARVRGVEPFSPGHYAAMRPLWEMLAGAGQKFLTVTLLDLPWNHQCFDEYRSLVQVTEREDGSWRYDWSRFDEYVEFGRSCGIGPYLSCWTMCPWGNVHRWRNEAGEEVVRELPPGTGEYARFWTPYLAALRDHLREKGWLEHAFIAMDERSPREVDAIVRLVESIAPELKIQMAGDRSAGEFGETKIDYYAQSFTHLDEEFFQTVLPARKRWGLLTSYYVCCHPASPNTFVHSPREEAAWLAEHAVEIGLDGFLRWAYNSWPQDPDHDASFGNWPAGDTFLVYPDGSPSVRFLSLCNGIADALKKGVR